MDKIIIFFLVLFCHSFMVGRKIHRSIMTCQNNIDNDDDEGMMK